MRALKNFALVVLFSALAWGLAHAQSRTDSFNFSAAQVTRVTLFALPDAGWAAQWCGAAMSADGGTRLAACTDDTDLRMALNRTRADQLAASGANRLALEFRFPVDAGAP